MSDFKQASKSALAAFLNHRELVKTTPFLFPLVASSLGKRKVSKVKARRINLMDRASVGYLPAHMRDFVWEQLRKIQNEQEERERAGEEPRNIEEALVNNDSYLEAANIYCHATWSELDGEPVKFVLKESEESIERGRIWVGRVEAEDRFAFMMACNNADSDYAKRFELFRDVSGDDAGDRADRENVALSTVRAYGDEGSGLPPD